MANGAGAADARDITSGGGVAVPPVHVGHATHPDPFNSPRGATHRGRGGAAAVSHTHPTPLSAIPAEAALERLTSLIDRDPRNHQAYQERARLYMRQPHLLEFALADINVAIEIALDAKDDNTVVKYGLMQVEILHLMDRHTEASTQLKELVNAYIPAVNNIKPELTIQGLSMLLAEDPTDLVCLSRRAEYYEKMGSLVEALVDLDSYLTHDPKDLNVQLRKASLLKGVGQFDGTLAILDAITTSLTSWTTSSVTEKRKRGQNLLTKVLSLRAETLHARELATGAGATAAHVDAFASDSDAESVVPSDTSHTPTAHFATATTLGELSRIAGVKGATDKAAAPNPGSDST